ncbi:hypothetical protein BpHYR1_036541, partial [Brachionus plicatilis]
NPLVKSVLCLCCGYFNEPFLRNEQKIEGKLIRFLSQNSTVNLDLYSLARYALILLQDGNLASTNGQIINIWNYTDGKLLKSFVAHNLTIGSLLVLSNGDLTSMSSNFIKIWNSTSFVLKKSIFIGGGSILKNRYKMYLSSLIIGSIDGIEVFDPTNVTLISNFTTDSICCTESMATFDDYLSNKLILVDVYKQEAYTFGLVPVSPILLSLIGLNEIYDEWMDSLIVLPNGNLAGGSFSGIAFWKLEGQTFISLSSTKLSRSSTTKNKFHIAGSNKNVAPMIRPPNSNYGISASPTSPTLYFFHMRIS